MEFTNQQFKEFRKDLKEALAEVERKYQVEIQPKNISYTDNDFTLKLNVVNVSNGLDAEQTQFNNLCSRYGFTPNDYKKQIRAGGKVYELVGFKEGARKNQYVIRDIRTNQTYVCGYDLVHPIDGPSHVCKYCGHRTTGSNPDELCDSCKEVFGHSYYSDL